MPEVLPEKPPGSLQHNVLHAKIPSWSQTIKPLTDDTPTFRRFNWKIREKKNRKNGINKYSKKLGSKTHKITERRIYLLFPACFAELVIAGHRNRFIRDGLITYTALKSTQLSHTSETIKCIIMNRPGQEKVSTGWIGTSQINLKQRLRVKNFKHLSSLESSILDSTDRWPFDQFHTILVRSIMVSWRKISETSRAKK